LAFIYFVFARESDFGRQFLHELPIHLFFLANIFPVGFSITWSLAAEEQFYLIWPFIEKHLGKFIYILLAIMIGLNQFHNFKREFVAANFGVPTTVMETTFTPILFGVLLAHLLNQPRTFLLVEKLLRFKFSPIILFSVLLLLLNVMPRDIGGLPLLCIHTLLALIVAAIIVSPQSMLTTVLSGTAVTRIGAVSFGIYLFHIHCIMVVRGILSSMNIDNNVLLFAASFATTFLVAELSYRFYEQRFLQLKSRFN